MRRIVKPVVYTGKLIEYEGKQYRLYPERSICGCNGCDLLGKQSCVAELTKYCTQGYILKKV